MKEHRKKNKRKEKKKEYHEKGTKERIRIVMETFLKKKKRRKESLGNAVKK